MTPAVASIETLLTQQPANANAPAYEGKSETQDNLAQLIQWFEDSEEASYESRKLSERDRDYYDNKQLTSEEIATLNKRGQPDIINNVIQSKIDFIIGWEAANRADPKAFPRTQKDDDAAEAATDGLRYVKDDTDLEQHFSASWECMNVEGYNGAIELVVEEAGPPGPDGVQKDPDIKIVHWDWDRTFYDPHSRKHDFSDARYMGGVIWMDAEEAKAKWPGKDTEQAIDTTAADIGTSATLDDRPRWKKWASGSSRKRVRIVQMYYREPSGGWHHCTFTKGGKMESIEVPFRDQDDKPFCPMFMQSAYVDRENNRYGIVRAMIGPQDEINKRRSKALHLLSVRQSMGEEGAVDDIDLMKAELAKPDGHVRVNPGFKFEMIEQQAAIQGNIELMQEAKQSIESIGPNASLMGDGPDAASGKAIRLNQQAGQMSMARMTDRHKHLKKRVYKGIWSLIRQFKKSQWWVRVTDDEKNVKFVGFNRPVTMAEDLLEKAIKEGVPEPEARAKLDEMLQSDPQAAQQLQQVIRIANVPADMSLDITIEEVPDTSNMQEEQFAALTGMAPAVVFPPKVYIKASNLRNKEKLIEELEPPPGAPVPPTPEEIEAKKLEMQMQAKQAADEQTMRIEQQKADAAAQAKERELSMMLEMKEREFELTGRQREAEFMHAQRMREMELTAKQREIEIQTSAKERMAEIDARNRAKKPDTDGDSQ